MLEEFSKFLSTGPNKPGTVLHIGAGICSELSTYQLLKFEKIELIEANKNLTDELAKKTRDISHVNIQNLTVSSKGGEVAFVRTNNPRFDSLKKPSAITKYFPNISVVEEVHLSSRSLGSIIEKLSLDQNKQNVLVLEVQGAEAEILDSLTPAILQSFAWIVLQTSELELYYNEPEITLLNKIMEKLAFDYVYNLELVAPFCERTYKRNQAKLALEKEHQAKLALEKENQELLYRQAMLDTEIVKAETQLEFIKDVILREKAF
jgi:FkbM family methyltransferase